MNCDADLRNLVQLVRWRRIQVGDIPLHEACVQSDGILGAVEQDPELIPGRTLGDDEAASAGKSSTGRQRYDYSAPLVQPPLLIDQIDRSWHATAGLHGSSTQRH
jgi:hypothetical protein